jgi:hypothetical protein
MIIACLECYTALRILGETSELDALVGKDSEFWPDGYTCVACNKKCSSYAETDIEAGVLARMKIRDLTPQEAYAAQLGLGTPDEMVCDASTVRELFARPIKTVRGFTIPGTSRFCLTEILLEDGICLYFGASTHGAVVYRISRPTSYAQRVLEGT